LGLRCCGFRGESTEYSGVRQALGLQV
jgi:hypothetical protein